MRWWTKAFVCALAFVLFSLPASAVIPQRRSASYVLGLHNGARVVRSVRLLSGDSALEGCAQRHANRMRDAGRIWHSTCGRGENVGAGPSMGAIFKAFLNSDAHRSNIFSPGWRRAGVGVARSNQGTFYIAVAFS